MAKFPICNTEKDRQLLRDEYSAHVENRRIDMQNSIRNRTMTKKSYSEITHCLRKFFWNLKQNKFQAGLF